MGSLLLRKSLVFFGLLVLLLASGITFGWTALEVALKRDKIFPNATESDRNTRLQAIMTTGTVAGSFGGIIFGLLLDQFGPGLTNFFSGVVFVAGCIVFGYSVNYEVGYGLIAIAGSGVLTSGFRLGAVFPDYTAYIMTAVTCCFDSSTIVFAIYNFLNSQLHVTLRQFFVSLACVVGGLQVVMMLLWALYKSQHEAPPPIVIDSEDEMADDVIGHAKAAYVLVPEDVDNTASNGDHFTVSHHHNTSTGTEHRVILLSDDEGDVYHVPRPLSRPLSRHNRRSTVTLVEEVLAMPPEMRAANVTIGEYDDIVAVNDNQTVGMLEGDDVAAQQPIVVIRSHSRPRSGLKSRNASRTKSRPHSRPRHATVLSSAKSTHSGDIVRSVHSGNIQSDQGSASHSSRKLSFNQQGQLPDMPVLSPHTRFPMPLEQIVEVSQSTLDTNTTPNTRENSVNVPITTTPTHGDAGLNYTADDGRDDIVRSPPLTCDDAHVPLLSAVIVQTPQSHPVDNNTADHRSMVTSARSSNRYDARSINTYTTATTQTVPMNVETPSLPLIDQSFLKQVRSKEFVFVLSFSIITFYRLGWYLSSLQPFLSSIGDKHNVYSQIATVILPFEACIVPITMWILQKKGLWVGAITASVVAILQCVFQCIAVLPLQIIVAVLFLLFRSLALSVLNTFVIKVFGTRNVGTHAGALRLIGGPLLFTQVPLMSYVQHQLHHNFLPVHIGFFAFAVAMALLCAWIRYASRNPVLFTGTTLGHKH